MKFKLGLAMTLCIALGTANVVAFAGENTSALNAPATAIAAGVVATETPAIETPAVETPAVETPAVETPAEETPAAETPAVETPVVETPAAETPAVETPAVETPAVETPAVETPAAETPAVETPAAEIIEIPEVEIPLAEELPLLEVPLDATTLKIVHRKNGLFGATDTEEVITNLTAGEIVHTTDYAQQDEILLLLSEGEDVVLQAGENEIVIEYLLLREDIEPSMFIEIDETSSQIVEEVSAE